MEENISMTETKDPYAGINGLGMYYEVHGEGQPLTPLHISVVE